MHFDTSKSAVIGMAIAMDRELGDGGINVNCIRPNFLATEADRAANPTQDLRKTRIAQQCIKRRMESLYLVGLKLYLSAPVSSYISGQKIACDCVDTNSS